MVALALILIDHSVVFVVSSSLEQPVKNKALINAKDVTSYGVICHCTGFPSDS